MQKNLSPRWIMQKIFTKLDSKSGYWQIKIDEESSKLLIYWTSFSRLQYNRLPYRMHSASEVFQQDIVEIIQDCEMQGITKKISTYGDQP